MFDIIVVHSFISINTVFVNGRSKLILYRFNLTPLALVRLRIYDLVLNSVLRAIMFNLNIADVVNGHIYVHVLYITFLL